MSIIIKDLSHKRNLLQFDSLGRFLNFQKNQGYLTFIVVYKIIKEDKMLANIHWGKYGLIHMG